MSTAVHFKGKFISFSKVKRRFSATKPYSLCSRLSGKFVQAATYKLYYVSNVTNFQGFVSQSHSVLGLVVVVMDALIVLVVLITPSPPLPQPFSEEHGDGFLHARQPCILCVI
jgi:hypothetical protein